MRRAHFFDYLYYALDAHYTLKYTNCAYDVYPKNRDISTGIIRIKEEGKAVEEARGTAKTLFKVNMD